MIDGKESYLILDAEGYPITSLSLGQIYIGVTPLPSIWLEYAFEPGLVTKLGGQLTALGYQYLLSPAGNIDGYELIDETWLEAKPSGGVWTPIGGNTQLAITPVSQTVELRLNVPFNAETKGLFRFSLAILFGQE